MLIIHQTLFDNWMTFKLKPIEVYMKVTAQGGGGHILKIKFNNLIIIIFILIIVIDYRPYSTILLTHRKMTMFLEVQQVPEGQGLPIDRLWPRCP